MHRISRLRISDAMVVPLLALLPMLSFTAAPVHADTSIPATSTSPFATADARAYCDYAASCPRLEASASASSGALLVDLAAQGTTTLESGACGQMGFPVVCPPPYLTMTGAHGDAWLMMTQTLPTAATSVAFSVTVKTEAAKASGQQAVRHSLCIGSAGTRQLHRLQGKRQRAGRRQPHPAVGASGHAHAQLRLSIGVGQRRAAGTDRCQGGAFRRGDRSRLVERPAPRERGFDRQRGAGMTSALPQSRHRGFPRVSAVETVSTCLAQTRCQWHRVTIGPASPRRLCEVSRKGASDEDDVRKP